MAAISRWTLVDRRPQLRWSAAFAGTAIALGLWMLLEQLDVQLGLAAMIAILLGATIAGWLAGTDNRKLGALHGAVVWAVAPAIGAWVRFDLGSLGATTMLWTLGIAVVGGALGTRHHRDDTRMANCPGRDLAAR